MFVAVCHFHHSQLIGGKAVSQPLELARTLPANSRLGWKGLTVINTLAYYNTAGITAVRSCLVQAPGSRNWRLLYPDSFSHFKQPHVQIYSR